MSDDEEMNKLEDVPLQPPEKTHPLPHESMKSNPSGELTTSGGDVLKTSLLAKRKTVRTKATNLIKHWQGIKTSPNPVADDVAFIIHRLTQLQVQLNELSSQLMPFGEIDDGKYDDAIDEGVFHARRLLNRLEPKQTSPAQNENAASVSGSSTDEAHRGTLPKIPLPEFSGNYLDWRPFWDTFQSLVDRRDMPKIDKFIYLKQCLKGNARRAISGLDSQAASYDIAVKKLKRRFGNPFNLIGLYSEKLHSLPFIKVGDLESFRTVVDQFEECLHYILLLAKEIQLDPLAVETDKDTDDEGGDHDQTVQVSGSKELQPGKPNAWVDTIASYLLAPILLRRLPDDVCLEWNRNHDRDRFHLRRLMRFLSCELETRESLQSSELSTSQRKFVTVQPKQNTRYSGSALVAPDSPSSTGAGLYSTSNSSDNLKSKRKCGACDQSYHRFKDCKKFNDMSAIQRTQLLQKLNRCLLCIGIHPRNNEPCPKPDMKCASCQGPHHRLLCNSSTGGSQSDPALSSILMTLPAMTPSVEEEEICLKIVRAKIFNTRDDRHEDIFIYLDDGAKRSYIRQDIAERLGLEILTEKQLSTASFGGEVHTIESKHVVFRLSGVHSPYFMDIAAWTTPNLCAPIRQSSIPSLPEILRQFEPWGDTFDGGCRTISVILGADQLTRVTGDLHYIPGVPTIVETFFGNVFYGPFPGVPASPSLSTALCAYEPPQASIEQLWNLETIGIDGAESKDYPVPILDNGRYTVTLPFRGEKRPKCNRLPALAVQKRIMTTLNAEKRIIYDEKMEALITDGIIEPASTPPTQGFFLPHHCVWGKKPRIVFNGSSSTAKGLSLNSCLDPGPNLLGSLQDVLIRFRLNEFAVVADIKSAFHSLSVHEEHRQWLKLHWKGKDFQFTRLPFGLSCSPFLLHSTVIYHVKSFSPPQFASSVLNSLYCDDVLKSGTKENETIRFLNRTTQILRSGGMDLIHKPEPQRVLGVAVKPRQDILYIDLSSVQIPTILTRRTLLSTVAAIFDPLGFISPFVIQGRLLMQEAWTLNLGWDDILPPTLQFAFKQWISDIYSPPLYFPRWSRFHEQADIHIFCDASSKAYAFVSYVVPDFTEAFFFFGRARAAPLKPAHSIPRLELLAATIAARFGNHLVQEICNPFRIYIWSDSTCVLAWIKNGVAKRDLFVQNRIKQIAELDNGFIWKYVPSAQNPADICSRGGSFKDMDLLYQKGPDFITQPESEWPAEPCAPPQLAVPQDEVFEKYVPLLDISRYSTLHFAVGTLGWIKRFVGNCKAAVHHSPLNKGPLTSNERASSLQHLLSEHQKEFYPDELRHLENHDSLPCSSSLSKLHVGVHDGLLAVFPRTNTQPLPLLHPRSSLAHLVIQYYHCGLLHQGPEATLSEIRQHMWIPKGRSIIRQIVHKCPGCRRYRTKPFQTPESTLQPFRTTPCAPFEECGLDFFGPLFLEDGSKVWVLLITCAVTRALHLELVSSGSAEDTWIAIRKFLARRVRPFREVNIHSDNAKAFLKVSTMRFPNNPIYWKFIPVRSPSWGGWWERLVQTVKNSLRPSIHGLKLQYQVLEAIIAEVESVINLRPLTQVSIDVDDPAALCPSDFLISKVDIDIDPNAVPATNLRRMLLLRDKANRSFWRIWSKQYLMKIAQWEKTSGLCQVPTVGAVALLKIPTPRGQWPLVRIIETIPGRDGVSRAAKVLVRGKTTTVATKNLCPMEGDLQSKTIQPPQGIDPPIVLRPFPTTREGPTENPASTFTINWSSH